MSEPTIPDVTQPESLTDLLESIALEETALAHVINAEGEKIQSIIANFDTFTPDQILELQNSVRKTLRMPIKQQILLQFKLEDVLDFKEATETPVG